MKFPSVQSVFAGASRTFLRFPMAIGLAVVGTIFCMLLVHDRYDARDAHYWYINVAWSAYLGMMGSIAMTVLAERRRPGKGAVVGLQAGVVLLAVLFYLSSPDHFATQWLVRLILYALGLHWLVACIAFVGRMENNGFWVYNKRLFLRILTSALYTMVLYLGLMLALLAIEQLFKVHVGNHLYLDIWCVLAGVFNTWFFLAGFPQEYDDPAMIAEYPKGLKVFTQYVLLPIITVYLLILYAYMFRIIVTAVWPYGWVSYLVLGFSVAGILAILLVWPLRAEENNKWISGYSRFFYFALFPLIIMLFIAIFKRVAIYGITERRYFVLALAVWLLGAAVYFLASKRKNIQLIPWSLFLLAFIVSFGPWGVEGVSLASQQRRLKGLLIKNKLFAAGKVVRAAGGAPISLADRKAISDVTDYIVEVHGYRVLRPWFDANLDSLVAAGTGRSDYAYARRQNERDAVMGAMGVRYANRWEKKEPKRFRINSSRGDKSSIPVSGYDYMLPDLSIWQSDSAVGLYQLGKYPLSVRLNREKNQLLLFPGVDSALVLELSPVAMAEGYEQWGQFAQLPDEKMTISTGNSQWACRLVLRDLGGAVAGKKRQVTNLQGYLLMRRK